MPLDFLQYRAGNMMISAVIATIVMTGGLISVLLTVEHQQKQIAARSVGAELAEVGDALNTYMRLNYSTLAAASTTIISSSDLVAEGGLSEQFPTTNHFGATYQFSVSGGTSLTGLVNTTGGVAYQEQYFYDAMFEAGARSGLSDGTNLVGLGGLWSETLAALPNSVDEGELGYLVLVTQESALEPYLYRSAVAGLPQANQMATDLNMNGNSITSAGEIGAATVSVSGEAVFNSLAATTLNVGSCTGC